MIYTVSNNEELNEIVQIAGSGDTIVLKSNPEAPYEVNLVNFDGGPEGITITSENPDDLSVIATINMANSSGVHFDKIEVNSDMVQDTRPDWRPDIYIKDSQDISFTNSYLHGDASGPITDAATQIDDIGETMSWIKNVDGFVFENNTIEHYLHGLSVEESDNIRITNNEITEMHGDGIRMGSVQNVVIDSNHIHNFYGTSNDINHTDFIQLWAIRPEQTSGNITISNNILDTGDGRSAQAIFLRNEAADGMLAGDSLDASELYYYDINIENNLIYSNSIHGITVGKANGVTINNNTVIYNEQDNINDIAIYPPQINVDATNSDVVISNNITSRIEAPESAQLTDNYVVDYFIETSDNYYQDVFVNVGSGGKTSLSQLAIDPNGPLAGSDIGASFSKFDENPATITPAFESARVSGSETAFTFDASLSAGPDGFLDSDDVTYRWEFGDGATKYGQVITHDFESTGYQTVKLYVDTPDGQSFETQGSVESLSPVLLSLSVKDGKLVDGADFYDTYYTYSDAHVTDDGYDISSVNSKDHINVNRSANQLFALDELTLSLGVKRHDGQSDGGVIFYLYNAYHAYVTDTGQVVFDITLDDGSRVQIDSGNVRITDENWHHISITIDSLSGTGSLYIDGVKVGSEAITGKTKPVESWNFIFGDPNKDGFDGTIDSVVMLSDIADDASIAAASKMFIDGKSGGAGEVAQSEIVGALSDRSSSNEESDPEVAPEEDDSDDGAVTEPETDDETPPIGDQGSLVEDPLSEFLRKISFSVNTLVETRISDTTAGGTDNNDLIYYDASLEKYFGYGGYDVLTFKEGGQFDSLGYRGSIEAYNYINDEYNHIEIKYQYLSNRDGDLRIFGDSIDTANVDGEVYYIDTVTIDGHEYNYLMFSSPAASHGKGFYVDADINLTINGAELQTLTAEAESVLAGRGIEVADVIKGSAGAERLVGGASDDIFLFDELDYQLWGGDGQDTVYFSEAGDVAPTSGHWSIEVYDMENGAENTMFLELDTLPGAKDSDPIIRGDVGDSIVIEQEMHLVGTENIDGQEYNRYVVGDIKNEHSYQILVDTDVRVDSDSTIYGIEGLG